MLFATVIIVLVGLSTSDPLSRKEIAKPRADDTIYRLKTDVIPKEYTLKLTPNFDDKTFEGDVKIVLEIKVNTKSIIFHHRNLSIDETLISITEFDDPTITIGLNKKGPVGLPLQEFYEITTKKILQKGKQYVLHIPKFEGILDGLRGFYYAEYIDEQNTLRKFATTHFEPTGARQAFPCFDEPNFKAQFKIYIIRPASYNSVSNMKLKSTRYLDAGKKQAEDEFELSVQMSTYLVAFIVSEMNLTDVIENNIIRTLAPPEDIREGHAAYSVETGNMIIESLEKFVDVKYSMDKMYQAAIPNNYFSPGAMENWGLVTYRNNLLLVTKETTTAMQQQIDTIIAHEFAHQWFGNLATQEWWKYLWLSEGFATYFQYKITDGIKPDWKLMEQFIVRVTQLAFGPDSLDTTRIMNHDAGSPQEVSALFDRIAYEKSGAVIRMIEAIMTVDIFKIGLNNYLTERKYNSADPKMLYESLDIALNKSTLNLPQGLTIESIMNTWDSQKGYPLVTATRNYDGNEQIVELVQNRFIYKPEEKQTWAVPINYATRGRANFKNIKATEWLTNQEKSIEIKELNGTDWLILNKQEAYYYRVNYDDQNWNLITDALMEDHVKINVLNRAQLIDDSFNIAKFELLNYSIPLSLSLYLQNEVEYVPFLSFFNAITFLNDKISATSSEKPFQEYVLNVLTGIYKHLGFNIKNEDSHTDKLNRVLVINYLCNFNHSECRSKALFAFKTWQTGSTLPLDLESTLLCGAMRTATLEDWNYLYEIYLKNRENREAKQSNFQTYAVSAMGCSEDSSILRNFLDLTMPAYRNGISFTQGISATIKGGSIGVQTAFHYVSQNFIFLLSLYGNRSMSIVIRDIGSKLTTEQQLDNLEALAATYDLPSVFAEGILKAKENVEWNKNNLYQISTWLEVNKYGGSETLLPQSMFLFIILYSVVIKIF